MANTLEADILRILNETRDDIRANMERENINASGRTSESIRVQVTGETYAIVGGNNNVHTIHGLDVPDTAPIPTLEIGRKGGGNPPVPKGFYYIIQEWSRVKGLSFSNENERNTFAFFVSRKIAREGTRRNIQNANVYSTPVMNAKSKLNQLFNSSLRNTIRAALGGEQISFLKGAFTE